MESKLGFSRRALADVLYMRGANRNTIRLNKDNWDVSFSGSREYSKRFYEVLRRYMKPQIESMQMPILDTLPLDLIRLLVRKKQSLGEKVHILDVMSYGEVIRDLGLDGAAMALQDIRPDSMKQTDEENNISLIPGDILTGKVWSRLDKQYKPGHFDFIFCRPYAAVDNIPSYREIYGHLLGHMYPHLSNDNGILLAEYNDPFLRKKQFAESIEVLNSTQGLTTLTGNGVFMLVKGSDAPVEFSEIKFHS